jgi:hypothetical protein
MTQPMSTWSSANECTSDQSSPDQEDEESSNIDRSSIFSEALSNNSDSSIGTAAAEEGFSDVGSILNRTFDTPNDTPIDTSIDTSIGTSIDTSIDTAFTADDQGEKVTENDQITVTTKIHVDVFWSADAISGWCIGGYLPFRCVEASDMTDFNPLMYSSTISSYTLVRVKLLNDRAGLQLDVYFRNIAFVPSLKQLNDGSWEILVQIAYIPALPKLLRYVHGSFILHKEYEPLAPLGQDIECFGRDRAEALSAFWFRGRVEQRRQSARSIVAAWYTHCYMQKEQEITRRIGIGGKV